MARAVLTQVLANFRDDTLPGLLDSLTPPTGWTALDVFGTVAPIPIPWTEEVSYPWIMAPWRYWIPLPYPDMEWTIATKARKHTEHTHKNTSH